MAEVKLAIGGHHYTLTCADGEESELLRLGAVVEEQVAAARAAVGGLTETRQLLFAALFLADKLSTGRQTSNEAKTVAARIDAMTEQIARLSSRVERG